MMVRRVLIADPHALMRGGLRSLLEASGKFRIISEAGTGQEALSAARATRPDIAIVEFSLPGTNGFDFLAAIRGDLPNTHILIYTLYDREEVVLEAFRRGASAYVLKSMPENYLVEALAAISVGKKYFKGVLPDELPARRSAKAVLLTDREREVVRMIADGQSSKEVGENLEIGLKTVETHRAAIMRKLNLRTAADLVRYAVRNGLVAL